MALRASGQAALIRRQKTARGTTVTVTRFSTVVTLTGWYDTALAVLTGDGGRFEVSEREWFFTVADYVTAGLDEPQAGDRFQASGEDEVFECRTPRTGEPAWRFSDAGHTLFRIHSSLQRVT